MPAKTAASIQSLLKQPPIGSSALSDGVLLFAAPSHLSLAATLRESCEWIWRSQAMTSQSASSLPFPFTLPLPVILPVTSGCCLFLSGLFFSCLFFSSVLFGYNDPSVFLFPSLGRYHQAA